LVKGVIGCKFSVFTYLLAGIEWVNDFTDDEKIQEMTTINLSKNFKNPRLTKIFLENTRIDPSKEITNFDDIVFEDGIAFLGIVKNNGYESNAIRHYFLIKQNSNGYSIVSSYGSEFVSIFQYETSITEDSFDTFVSKLNKINKNRYDKITISSFMRWHFLWKTFIFIQRKSKEMMDEIYPHGIADDRFRYKNNLEDIRSEIKQYTTTVSKIIQFESILGDIQDEIRLNVDTHCEAEEPDTETESEILLQEIDDSEMIKQKLAITEEAEEEAKEEAEEAQVLEDEPKGGMRKKRTQKGKRQYYVSRRKYLSRHHYTLRKK
jgi:hypothetical protein